MKCIIKPQLLIYQIENYPCSFSNLSQELRTIVDVMTFGLFLEKEQEFWTHQAGIGSMLLNKTQKLMFALDTRFYT